MLCKELEAEHGIEMRLEAIDLIAPGACEALHARTSEAGIEIDLLVNNAGLGLYGAECALSWPQEKGMLELDVLALVELTKRYLPGMLARRRGWVIQVASVAAYQPTPGYAAYAAAKSFVLSYGVALSRELRDSGVRVTVLSPGITQSEFFEIAGQAPALYHRVTRMSADQAAEAGLRAVLRGRSTVVPGLLNKAGTVVTRLLSRDALARISGWLMRAGAAKTGT